MLLLLAFQLSLTPLELAPGIVNKPYDSPQFQLAGGAQCARNEASVRIIGGRLPVGLQLSGAGMLSGVPKEEGVFPIVLEAGNGCASIQAQLKLEINGAPIFDASERNISWVWKTGSAMPAPREFLVAGGWPGLPYRIEGLPAWLEMALRLGTIPPKNSPFEADLVTLAPYPTGLVPGKYLATLIVTAWGASRSPRILVELEVQ